MLYSQGVEATGATTAIETQTGTGISTLRRYWTVAVFFGALWFVLCRHLSSEWSLNEQYNYGWFVPFFTAYLLWLRWEDAPLAEARVLTRTATVRLGTTAAIVLLFLLLPVRLFEIANPDWRPVGWLHAGIVIVLTLQFFYLLGSAPWLRHFAFPVLFFFVAVPWPSFIETPIVQGLMSSVAAAAAEMLTWFGIPAQLEGNLIRVSTGLVGVNEACSGVRSLQTSLMIGLLFGELKRLRVRRRIALVIGALVVALLANVARAFVLVWIAANENVGAVSKWHDIAGYAVVGIVFATCLLLASKLENRKAEVKESLASRSTRSHQFAFPTLPFLLSAAWLGVVEAGCEYWYRSHEWRAPAAQRWTVNWPEQAPGFRELPIDHGVRSTLRFDEGREAAWSEAANTRCLLYFFRWNPGGSSVVRARAHRPDICLPSAGWRQVNDSGVREMNAGTDLRLPFREVSFERINGGTVAHTFFCLYEDRRTGELRPDLALAAGLQPDWSFPARWRAVRDGVRNMGQQVLEFALLTPERISSEQAEAQFTAMLPKLVRSL